MLEDTRILIILIFFVLFLLGIVLYILRKKIKSNTPGIALMIIGGFMGTVLTLTVMTTPTLKERNLNDYLLFQAPPEIFKEIIINSNSDRTKNNFKKENYAITNISEINEIISSLHTLKEFAPNHPQAFWSFLVTLRTDSNEITIEVDNTKSETNGTIITHWSSGNQGWVLGSYRCDRLGKTIEKILKKN